MPSDFVDIAVSKTGGVPNPAGNEAMRISTDGVSLLFAPPGGVAVAVEGATTSLQRLLNRAASFLGSGAAVFFHDLDGSSLTPPWSVAGTWAVDATRAAGVWSALSSNAQVLFKGTTACLNPAAKPWHLAGRFAKSVAPTAGNILGHALTPFGDGVTNTCHVGIVQALSPTYYVFRVVKAGVTTWAISTVPIDTNFHIGELWFDGATVWGSFDNEIPVQVALTANVPTAPSSERFGVEVGTGAAAENFFDFQYLAVAR